MSQHDKPNDNSIEPFSQLPLSNDMLANLETLNYEHMTEIQSKSLPLILEGKDIWAQAKTGSGKTAAFAIGLLVNLQPENFQTQALVLCPTRELADQVSNEIRRIARAIPNIKILTLCGGKPMGPQLASLQRSPHIVVGTPGRVFKHANKGTLTLSKVKTLILDEADRMLDMGFQDDMMRIINRTPQGRQTLLFSATYPDSIKGISDTIQTDPESIQVESLHDNNIIHQVCFETQSSDRVNAVIRILKHYQPKSCVIFCNRKIQCQSLSESLRNKGFYSLALHGDLEQYERDQVLVQFSNQSCPILIATDVAARGLDIKDLEAVIVFELSHDPESHIHRIGRTGRAGREGLAISLYTPTEKEKLQAIETFQGSTLKIETLSSLRAKELADRPISFVTLCIFGGRKDKLRPGDILGSLTSSKEIEGSRIGKIDLFDKVSYVAVEESVARQAVKLLANGKIKGRKFRVKKLY